MATTLTAPTIESKNRVTVDRHVKPIVSGSARCTAAMKGRALKRASRMQLSAHLLNLNAFD